MQLVCSWYAVGMQLVCSWYAIGMQLVCSWYAIGMQLVCNWYAVGMQLVCIARGGQRCMHEYQIPPRYFEGPGENAMTGPDQAALETDPRFPSGPWTGFFLQKLIPGRHLMELLLTFSKGNMTGEGRDLVGQFIIRGQHDLADATCHSTKRYAATHALFY